MTKKVTQIIKIIEEMTASTGRIPTYEAIRARLGTGSNSTIKKALTQYQERHTSTAKTEIAPNLPGKLFDQLGTVAHSIWEAGRNQAKSEWADERKASSEKIKALEDEIQKLRDKVELQEIWELHISTVPLTIAPPASIDSQKLEQELQKKSTTLNRIAEKLPQLLKQRTLTLNELTRLKAENEELRACMNIEPAPPQ